MKSFIHIAALVCSLLFTKGFTLEILVNNDGQDLVLGKRALLRFVLQDQEKGIFKKSLLFSTDDTHLKLIAWHPLASSTRTYSQAFGKQRTMYMRSFSGWLLIDWDGKEPFSTSIAKNIYLTITCLVERKDGTVQSCNISVPLSTMVVIDNQQKEIFPFATKTSDSNKQNIIKIMPQTPPPLDVSRGLALEKDFSFADALATALNKIKTLMFALFFNWFFMLFLFLLGILFTFILLWGRRHIRFLGTFFYKHRLLSREMGFITISSLFLIVCLLTYFLIPAMANMGMWMAFCSWIFIYGLCTGPSEKFLWGRIKKLCAILAGSALLPLTFKICLIYYGL